MGRREKFKKHELVYSRADKKSVYCAVRTETLSVI